LGRIWNRSQPAHSFNGNVWKCRNAAFLRKCGSPPLDRQSAGQPLCIRECQSPELFYQTGVVLFLQSSIRRLE
jgi:hypothetical protein